VAGVERPTGKREQRQTGQADLEATIGDVLAASFS
jgi:hypothetical protein